MRLIFLTKCFTFLTVLCLPIFAQQEVVLPLIRFQVQKDLDLSFQRTERAPNATLKGRAEIVKGQTQIDLSYRDMKPALLFGGDITCYVLWAITSDGVPENLGELWVRGKSGKWDFTSNHTAFGLVLTAEMYVHADRPSPLVLFTASPAKRTSKTEPLVFRNFSEAPAHELESIVNVGIDEEKPFDLLQAEKTLALAQRMGIEESQPGLYRQAFIAMGQANGYATRSMSRPEVKEYARKSTTDSNEAIRMTLQQREAEALAKAIAARKAEMAQLEEKARNSEALARKAETAMSEARIKLDQVQTQRAQAESALREMDQKLETLNRDKLALEQEKADMAGRLLTVQNEVGKAEQEKAKMAEQLQSVQNEVGKAEKEMTALRVEKQTVEAEMGKLRLEKAELIESKKVLELEKAELAGRLQSALSEVADTRDTARGFVVSLPDILFDLNKAELRHEAQLVISKLAGILLMMPQLQIRTEGHTDASGSEAYNQQLSERRAATVKSLLIAQGVAPEKVSSVGYGESKPIGDNQTAEGSRANRRVEVVIKEGKITD